MPGRIPWLAAGLLLTAGIFVCATVTGLTLAPAWSGAVWAVATLAADGLMFFGMIRLAQVSDEVDEACRAARLAVARERLHAAETLQAAVGQRLAGIAAKAAAASRALPHDSVQARGQIMAAGDMAREAVEQARALTADRRNSPAPETAAAPGRRAMIGARLAPAVLVVVLSAYTALSVTVVFLDRDSPQLEALLAAGYVLTAALLVYGLSRLAGLARELEALRREVARMTAMQEGLRLARDVHDLLGLGLSAVALKADLITALIGRDDVRATAEMEEIGRVCAAVRADIRRVTVASPRLSLYAEIATAKQVLTSAGVKVSARMPAGSLPAGADSVLAPVLREAVTNVLRHAAATACTMEVTVGALAVRLDVRNDGVVTNQPATRRAARGHGLFNLSARVHATGGQLTTQQEGERFILTARIPFPGTRLGRAGLEPRRPALPEPRPTLVHEVGRTKAQGFGHRRRGCCPLS